MQSMRSNHDPMVGLTWTDDIVARSAAPGENALRYLSLLSSAGLVPVLITPKSSTTILARLDGLVVPGGPDVAPARYGQEPGPHTETSIEELDALELEFVTAARARNLPILGICRGQQVLNVALGGTLRQHVDHPRWGPDPAAPIHEVQILDGTYLRHILRVDVAAVNSGHHQAVDRLAPSLTVPPSAVTGASKPSRLRIGCSWLCNGTPKRWPKRRVLAGSSKDSHDGSRARVEPVASGDQKGDAVVLEQRSGLTLASATRREGIEVLTKPVVDVVALHGNRPYRWCTAAATARTVLRSTCDRPCVYWCGWARRARNGGCQRHAHASPSCSDRTGRSFRDAGRVRELDARIDVHVYLEVRGDSSRCATDGNPARSRDADTGCWAHEPHLSNRGHRQFGSGSECGCSDVATSR